MHHLGVSSPLHFLTCSLPVPWSCYLCSTTFSSKPPPTTVFPLLSQVPIHPKEVHHSVVSSCFAPSTFRFTPTFLCPTPPLKPASLSTLHSLDQKSMYMKTGRKTGRGKEKGRQEGRWKKGYSTGIFFDLWLSLSTTKIQTLKYK